MPKQAKVPSLSVRLSRAAKGGRARAVLLTKKRRSQIARLAARARWGTALLLAFLCACGGGSEDVTWTGGLYGTLESVGPTRAVVVLHQGHTPFDYGDQSLVPFAHRLAAAGYRVLCFQMPPLPHDGMELERFTFPVTDALDGLPQDLPVFMIGLSGGGWTTTVVTAGDPRIVRGYSVAGDHPEGSLLGDAEGRAVEDYRALYAQAGDRLWHVYNWHDPEWLPRVTGDIGGPYVVDYENRTHSIGPWAQEWILADMEAVLDAR